MSKQNKRSVLRYYKPNRNLDPEKFACHLLLLFYPFEKKEGFLTSRIYSEKQLDPMVRATVDENAQIFEPNIC